MLDGVVQTSLDQERKFFATKPTRRHINRSHFSADFL